MGVKKDGTNALTIRAYKYAGMPKENPDSRNSAHDLQGLQFFILSNWHCVSRQDSYWAIKSTDVVKMGWFR